MSQDEFIQIDLTKNQTQFVIMDQHEDAAIISLETQEPTTRVPVVTSSDEAPLFMAPSSYGAEEETVESSSDWATWISAKIDATVDTTKRVYESSVKPTAQSVVASTKSGVNKVSTSVAESGVYKKVAEKIENIRNNDSRTAQQENEALVVAKKQKEPREPRYDEEGNLIEEPESDESDSELPLDVERTQEHVDGEAAEPRIRKRDILKQKLMENIVNPSKDLIHKMTEETERLRREREEQKLAKAEAELAEKAARPVQYDEEGNVIPSEELEEDEGAGDNWQKVRRAMTKIRDVTGETAVRAKDATVSGFMSLKGSISSSEQPQSEDAGTTENAVEVDADETSIPADSEEQTELSSLEIAKNTARERWSAVWESPMMVSVREKAHVAAEVAKDGVITAKEAVNETMVMPVRAYIASSSITDGVESQE